MMTKRGEDSIARGRYVGFIRAANDWSGHCLLASGMVKNMGRDRIGAILIVSLYEHLPAIVTYDASSST